MIGVATRGAAPYRQVISHGFLLDEKGRAMSKSAGNGIPPANVVEQYGADVLRLWVASTNYFEDVRFGPNILKQVAESYRRLRNTLRFLLGALADFTPGRDSVDPAQLDELDRWALHALQGLIADVSRAYESYEFHRATRALLDFCTTDLSAFYFDVLKDRLYASAPNDPVRRSAQTALYEIASALTRMLSPILSHTAEEAWQMLPGARAFRLGRAGGVPGARRSVPRSGAGRAVAGPAGAARRGQPGVRERAPNGNHQKAAGSEGNAGRRRRRHGRLFRRGSGGPVPRFGGRAPARRGVGDPRGTGRGRQVRALLAGQT
jgi:isoleucyl-tRNA synthetase